MRILSIGEAMVELGQSDQPGLWRLGIAGDTLNTAWYLRRLLGADWQVDYLSRVGQGAFSQQMVDFLSAEGIGTAHVARDPDREIGLYAISLTDGERSFAYWRDTSAARRLADDPAALNAALEGAALAYFSGITVAILPPEGRANLLATLSRAKAAGTRVVFDPNLRPRLWPDAATMRQGISDAAAGADLVLPSFDDEARIFGDSNAAATAARYREIGCEEVVVKDGAGDALLLVAGMQEPLVVPSNAVEKPVDTTGAGDSFGAGYLAARLQGQSPQDAVHSAHATAARVIQGYGGLVEL